MSDAGELVEIVDTNVYLSRWPTRRVPGDEPPDLVAKLRAGRVSQAWVGSFDALLHKDLAGVNARLAADCARYDAALLVPFGAVNPLAPDWEEDLRRCHEVHKMPGIRLHPNYHGYPLDDPRFARLLENAQQRKLIVQIVLRMEDPRTQHPLLQTPDVDPAPLVELLPKFPQLHMQLLNSLQAVRPDLLDQLLTAGNISVEIAMLEGVGGIQRLLGHMPLDRILFGSYFPCFAWEAAALKLIESPLGGMQRTAIARENARRMLSP
ncbi:MAG: amidohydrolase family protein [Pirellulaceae bacterium]